MIFHRKDHGEENKDLIQRQSGSEPPEEMAKAQNSTQAAKSLYPGNVSVNPKTGSAAVQFSVPSFSDLDLSLSFSSLASLYKAPFCFPNGVNLMGIPFIHQQNGRFESLNLNGQDYYLDKTYKSALIKEENNPEYYYSGLKYQTSKNIKFTDYRLEDFKPSLDLYDQDQILSSSTIYYELQVLDSEGNLKKYYFDEMGFCFALTDKYFINCKAFNCKHATIIQYEKNDVEDIYSSRLKSITNNKGNVLTFNYRNKDIEITYPVGPSGEAYQVYVYDESMEIILGHSLNDRFDYRLSIYLENENLETVTESIYDKEDENNHTNKIFELGYENDLVSYLKILDGKNTDNFIVTKYSYFGDRQNNFNYGYDDEYDVPDINTSQSVYGTVITTGTNRTVSFYNKLSQEIKTEIRSLIATSEEINGDLISAVYTVYPDVVSFDEIERTNILVSNYQDPIQKLTLYYNKLIDGGVLPVAISNSLTSFGNYGNLISEETYPIVEYPLCEGNHSTGAGELPVYPDDIMPTVKTTTEYDYEYVTPIKKTHEDTTTGKVTVQESILTSNKLNVFQEVTRFICNEKEESLQTVEYKYANDEDINFFYNDSTVLSKKIFFKENPDENILDCYEYNLEGSAEDNFGCLSIITTKYINGQVKPISVVTSLSIADAVIKEVGATGLTTTATYDLSGNLKTKIFPTGVSQSVTYDYIGRLFQSDICDSSKDLHYVNQINAYDFINQLLYSKERNEVNGLIGEYETQNRSYDYHNGGRLDTFTDANGNQTKFSYDDYRGLVSRKAYFQKNQDGTLVSYGDDYYEFSIENFDNAVRSAYAKITEIKGGESGSVVITKGLNNEVIYEKTSWINGDVKEKITSSYTLSGVLESTSVYVPSLDSTKESEMKIQCFQKYKYDLFGRVELVTQDLFDQENSLVHAFKIDHKYDNWSLDKETLRIFKTADGDYRTYKTHYNILGQIIGRSYVVGEQELSSILCYNENGDITSGCDFNGNTLKNEYEPTTGLLVTTTYKDKDNNQSNEISNEYNTFSRITKQLANDGFCLVNRFNSIGLPILISFEMSNDHLSTVDQDKAITLYDAKNRVKQYTDFNGFTFNFDYLPSNNPDIVTMKSIDGIIIGSVQYDYYGYDPDSPLIANLEKSMILKFSFKGIDYETTNLSEYDSLGRISVQTSNDGTNKFSTKFTYNNLNQVINKSSEIIVCDSISDSNISIEETYCYDVMNRLTSSTICSSEHGGLIIVNNYIYDAIGNIIEQKQEFQGGGSDKSITLFFYNNVNQLLRKETTVNHYNNEQVIQSLNTSEYKYDNNGNLIEEYSVSVDGSKKLTKKLEYNSQNQLISINKLSADNNEDSFKYAYYPSGQRALKRHNDSLISYLYDLSGGLSNSIFLSSGTTQELKQDSYFGDLRYISDILNDANNELQGGNIRLNKSNFTTIINEESELSFQSQNISDYGVIRDKETVSQPLEDSNTINFMQFPFLYGSGYYDSESGLQYMQSRYYSPYQERFISQDNADYEDLPNRYTYANSNPIMNHDLDGHQSILSNLFKVFKSTQKNGTGVVKNVIKGVGKATANKAVKNELLTSIAEMGSSTKEVSKETELLKLQSQIARSNKEGTRKVYSGHGATFINPETGNVPTTIVPEGTTINFHEPLNGIGKVGEPYEFISGVYKARPGYSQSGALSDAAARAIEQGNAVGGTVQSYGPGSVIPDITLFPPEGLEILGSRKTEILFLNKNLNGGIPLSKLLTAHMGEVDWAACHSTRYPYLTQFKNGQIL